MSFLLKKIKTDWEQKCWGRVKHMFYCNTVGVSHLEVTRGRRCSVHRHCDRDNVFYVHSGVLVIESWVSYPERRNLMVLCPGESVKVPAGIYHRFRVYDSGFVTEIYTPVPGREVRFDDILRIDEGGEDNLSELTFSLNEYGLWD